MNILFRCEASKEIGFGHAVRCLALAQEIKEYSLNVFFAMKEKLGIDLVRENGCNVLPITNDNDLLEIVENNNIKLIVFDYREHIEKNIFNTLKKNKILIATIDDPTSKRLLCDLAFYPPIRQVESMDWSAFEGKLYIGWDWVILRRQFRNHKSLKNSFGNSPLKANNSDKHILPTIFVNAGGSDPYNITLKIISALKLIQRTFKVQIVIGPGFESEKLLSEALLDSQFEYSILKNVSDMASVMKKCDIAIVSFGTVAYELALCGIPSIFLCISADHSLSASVFEKEGIAINLGVHNLVKKENIAQSCLDLLNNPNLSDISNKARLLVDGFGAKRIAGEIFRVLK